MKADPRVVTSGSPVAASVIVDSVTTRAALPLS